MAYEIYSYGNNDALVQVFNGIAALMGGSNYADLIRVVMLISLFAAVVGGIFAARFNGFNWFIGMTLFYMLLFVPKVTVIVVDKLTNQPPVTVDNVPIGLGFFAHFTSKIGDYLTTSFETVFSLPNDLTYQTHGVLFGNKLIKKSMSWEIPDADMRENFLAFVKNCTYRDIQDGTIGLQTLNTSQDIWGTMSTTNAGRVVVLPMWPWFPMSCSFAYTILNANANAMINDGLTRYGMQLNPQITVPAIAQATLANQLQAATTNLLGIANTGQQTVMQNYMRNILAGGGVALAQQLGDPAATQMALAQAQAEATADLSGKTMANIAEEALPMVRNTVEVICYAIFPIVFLTFLLPMTAAITSLKGYLYTLLWVQLWPPLYAVLNLVLTLESQRQMSSIAANGWGLSIASMDSIANTAISGQSIAGYLVIAIPVIAAGLVKGMDSVMTGIASAGTQSIQKSIGASGQAVGTGNLSYGTVNHNTAAFDMMTGNKNSTAPDYQEASSNIYRATGGALTTGANGEVYWQSTQSSGGFNAGLSHTLKQGFQEKEQHGIASAYREMANNQTSLSHAIREGTSNANETSSSESRAWQVLADVRSSFTEGASSGTSKLRGGGFAASGGVNAGAQVNIGKGKKGQAGQEGGEQDISVGGGKASGVGAGLGANAGFDYTNKSMDNDEVVYRKIDDAARSHGFKSAEDWANTLRQSETFHKTFGKDTIGTQAITSNLDEARDASVAKDRAESFGSEQTVNGMNPLVAELLREHGVDARKNPRAAAALLTEYLTNNPQKHVDELTGVAMKTLKDGDMDERALAMGLKWDTSGPVPYSAPVRQFHAESKTKVDSANSVANVDGETQPSDRTSAEQGTATRSSDLDGKEKLTKQQTLHALTRGSEVKVKATDKTDRKDINQ